jgi:hypothetical protein
MVAGPLRAQTAQRGNPGTARHGLRVSCKRQVSGSNPLTGSQFRTVWRDPFEEPSWCSEGHQVKDLRLDLAVCTVYNVSAFRAASLHALPWRTIQAGPTSHLGGS